MTRRRSSIGLFGVFGRSEDLRGLDAAFRAIDLHPALVPEGVKLALVNLMKDRAGGAFPMPEDYPAVAAIFGYCVMGAGAFGEEERKSIETRMDRAVAAGHGDDADIVLLALHAGLVQPSVIDRFDLSAEA